MATCLRECFFLFPLLRDSLLSLKIFNGFWKLKHRTLLSASYDCGDLTWKPANGYRDTESWAGKIVFYKSGKNKKHFSKMTCLGNKISMEVQRRLWHWRSNRRSYIWREKVMLEELNFLVKFLHLSSLCYLVYALVAGGLSTDCEFWRISSEDNHPHMPYMLMSNNIVFCSALARDPWIKVSQCSV